MDEVTRAYRKKQDVARAQKKRKWAAFLSEVSSCSVGSSVEDTSCQCLIIVIIKYVVKYQNLRDVFLCVPNVKSKGWSASLKFEM